MDSLVFDCFVKPGSGAGRILFSLYLFHIRCTRYAFCISRETFWHILMLMPWNLICRCSICSRIKCPLSSLILISGEQTVQTQPTALKTQKK